MLRWPRVPIACQPPTSSPLALPSQQGQPPLTSYLHFWSFCPLLHNSSAQRMCYFTSVRFLFCHLKRRKMHPTCSKRARWLVGRRGTWEKKDRRRCPHRRSTQTGALYSVYVRQRRVRHRLPSSSPLALPCTVKTALLRRPAGTLRRARNLLRLLCATLAPRRGGRRYFLRRDLLLHRLPRLRQLLQGA